MKIYFTSVNNMTAEAETVEEAMALLYYTENSRLKSIPDTAYFRNIVFDISVGTKSDGDDLKSKKV